MAGDPDRAVRRVAVCGGAGDFLLDDVRRSDVDVYVTSDLRHHPACEFLEHEAQRWSTSRTGLRSGPGCRWWRVESRATRGRYGGDPGQHDLHGPVDDATGHSRRSAESRPRRPASPAGPPGARLARRPAAPPARVAARAGRDRHAEASRAELDGKRRDAQIAVDDLTAEQAKVDADVELVKGRRQRDRDRMDQGLIASPKDLENMQGELESLQRRITSLEDDELEVMARLEDAQRARLAHRPGGRRRRAARRAGQSRDARTQELDAELRRIAADRGPASTACPKTS